MSVMRSLVLLALALVCNGAAGQPREHQVKAEFLFRFLSFVEWPPHALGPPGTPLVIAVLGADELHSELQTIVSGRRVNDRPVQVERVREGERPSRAHVLFVGRDARGQLRRLATTSELLLVGESDGALEQGALINFVVRDDRVRFEVAPDEAERRGLRIGARVLAVALHVKPGSPKP
jgi:hypothetical protein